MMNLIYATCFQYGPDILVCDEAHMIKNTRADTTQALKQVKTQRRIALTGSPLQNNLMEYYCVRNFYSCCRIICWVILLYVNDPNYVVFVPGRWLIS